MKQSGIIKTKVFVSYDRGNDQYYEDNFEHLVSSNYQIATSKPDQIGEMNPTLSIEKIRQQVRDKYLRDSKVTVVLIGSQTWQKKHIDWEISSSIQQTPNNSRSGLIGIILPTHSLYTIKTLSPYTIPPRLYENFRCGFAEIYKWSNDASTIQKWIHAALERRNKIKPNNSYPHFTTNRYGERWYK